MRVIGWSNGQPFATGAGYAVRLSGHYRDDYFDPGWHEGLPGCEHLLAEIDGG